MAGTNTPEDIRNEIEILSKGSLRQGQLLLYGEIAKIRQCTQRLQIENKWIITIGAATITAASGAFLYLISLIK